jgi:hypothetical protein
MSQSTARRSKLVPQRQDRLIIEYTNLLHQYRDPAAREVVTFMHQHGDNAIFVKRAQVLNKVFRLKAELTPVGV